VIAARRGYESFCTALLTSAG